MPTPSRSASATSASAASTQPRRDWYELRAYRLKSADAPASLLHGYLERALIPAEC